MVFPIRINIMIKETESNFWYSPSVDKNYRVTEWEKNSLSIVVSAIDAKSTERAVWRRKIAQDVARYLQETGVVKEVKNCYDEYGYVRFILINKEKSDLILERINKKIENMHEWNTFRKKVKEICKSLQGEEVNMLI